VEAYVDVGRELKVKQTLRSHLLNALLSPASRRLQRSANEMRRKIAGRAHVVSVFLQLDDPYSYLLAHYLPALASQYDIELRVYLSQALGDGFQPAPDMLAEYSALDAQRVARELGVPFLDKGVAPPVEHRRALLDYLAACTGNDDFLAEFSQVLEAYWRGDNEAAARRAGTGGAGQADRVIAESQALQKRLGHYNSAMLHYGGEWYWGVDRLHYLASRLDDLGLAESDEGNTRLASIRQAMHVSLPVKPPTAAKELPPLELFVSIRSPYSYLALQRIYEIADAFGLELRLRPVLPMVMRGMQVPRAKLLYIANDTMREADRRAVPFGKIADPVGAGVERCLAVFQYAESEHKGREFLLNAGVAIWSEAVDVATDKGMRKVTGRTGLFWPEVVAAMDADEWRAQAEENRESMMASGSWGVPTMRLGDEVFWGQDRDWLLVRHIEELCDTGDGIIV
jgi:2-hydroxychromene-2-carboxylate isomerase